MEKTAKKDGLLGVTNYGGVAVPPNRPTGGGLIGKWANRMRSVPKKMNSRSDSYLNTSEYRKMNRALQELFRRLSPEAQVRVINKGRAFLSTTINGEGYGTYIGRALNDARNRESSRRPSGMGTPKSAGQYKLPVDSSVIEDALSDATQNRRTNASGRTGTVPSPATPASSAGSASPKKGITGSLKNTPAAGQQKATTYTIKKGDTLGTIARRYGVDWRALAEANGIDDPNLIYAGVKLKIDPAIMGKKNKRKVAISRPRVTPPSMRTGERNFETPTRAEATSTNLPMDYGALSIDIPERP